MKAQRGRFAGERGQKGINRPELVAQFGYDTKYAYHMLRLGLQGLEFLKHGKIAIPIPTFIRDLLLAVRNGQYTKETVLQWAEELEADLQSSINLSSLPDRALEGPINQLLVELHETA
jgi:hypothetical protein